MKKIINVNFKNLDYITLLIMLLLTGIGLYCVKQVELFSSNKNGLFTKQLLGIVIGLVIIAAILFFDYHFICRLSYLMYAGILIILLCTLKFGNGLNNVNRWISIAGIPFQPSELTKVILILFLSYLCYLFRNKLDRFSVFFILAAVTALPIILILLEPHLSSCICILFIFCVIIFASGLRYRVIGKVLALFLPAALGIILSVTVFQVKIPFIKSYWIERVLSFRSEDEAENADGKYQQNQAIAAISSGRLAGKMLSGEAATRNYRYIYANESDFVFAVVGEEFGFLGSCAIVFLYLLLIIRCLITAAHAPDYLGWLISIGVSAYLIFQVAVNIGVATNLLPNTGLPLPFISNGLTSLISSMTSVGLVLSIRLRQKNKSPKRML